MAAPPNALASINSEGPWPLQARYRISRHCSDNDAEEHHEEEHAEEEDSQAPARNASKSEKMPSRGLTKMQRGAG